MTITGKETFLNPPTRRYRVKMNGQQFDTFIEAQQYVDMQKDKRVGNGPAFAARQEWSISEGA